MIQLIINICLMFGVFATVYVCPAYFCMGLLKVSNPDYTKSDLIPAWIPFANLFIAYKAYLGRGVTLMSLAPIIIIASIIGRYVLMMKFPSDVSLQVHTALAFMIILAVCYCISAFSVWMIMNDSGVYGPINKIVASIIYPLGMISIGTTMVKYMNYYAKNKSGSLI